VPALKIIYCNNLAVHRDHESESFCLVLGFAGPDGKAEAIYIVISPSGAKTLTKYVADELNEYEAEHGEVKTWKPIKEKTSDPNPTYLI
jgi:hypothetical protein